ncbi:EutN/CcmL family microcompartment protein [Lachnospiraceae bacterium 42-17]|jgi:ethanolamine utilization protein EutN|nr:EutN/CcmL family microcompartment protein [Dorea sp.]
MEIARVIGTVVATRKDESLTGKKLLLVQPLDSKLFCQGNSKVIVDTVGAGTGELVLFVSGAASRNAVNRADAAVDGAAVGIIDSVETDETWISHDRREDES